MTRPRGPRLTLTLDLRPAPSHLHATLAGEYTYDELKKALATIMAAAYEQPSLKLLIDCLAVTGNPTLRERFDLVAFALQQRINAILNGKSPRVATALVAVPPFAHPNRYAVRLLLERNLKITVCERVEDALAWLGAPPGVPTTGSDPGSAAQTDASEA